MKKRPHLYPVLILEDDLEVAGKIMLALRRVEPYLAPFSLDVTLLSTCEAVEELINPIKGRDYAVILMDRDCKAGGSFHVIDMARFGVEKIISISSTPEWNRAAQEMGIPHIVPKSFNRLDEFATEAAEKVLEILKSNKAEAVG